MNVLITAASRRVALVKLFKQAIRPLGGKVIAVDNEKYSPALFFADRVFKVPLVKDANYLKCIAAICRSEKISLVIPTIDPELGFWAQAKEEFSRDGVSVSVSDPDTIRIFTDKWNTFQALSKTNIPFPHSFFPGKDVLPTHFPLFVKPRDGRGSVGAYPIRNLKEYLFFSEYVKKPLMQTYLEGKEFTVDALFDRCGHLILCIPRYRLVIRSGVSDRGITFVNRKLTELILEIGRSFRFQGAINVQGKINNDVVTFFEINPRFSGGIQLSAASGVNFAELLVRESLGETLTPRLYDYQEGLLMTSYEDSLFVDKSNRLVSSPLQE